MNIVASLRARWGANPHENVTPRRRLALDRVVQGVKSKNH